LKELLIYRTLTEKTSTQEKILLLLSELRIMTTKQLLNFLTLDGSIIYDKVTYALRQLHKSNLIVSFKPEYSREKAYYLTIEGAGLIDSAYPVANDPIFNLSHYLAINDSIAEVIQITRQLSNFYSIESEQRTWLERHEGKVFKQSQMYNIPDFTLNFLNPNGMYYFEVELTAKTKHRYIQEVLPRYLQLLAHFNNREVFYICGTSHIYQLITEALNLIKNQRQVEFETIIFERFHVWYEATFKETYNNYIQSKKERTNNENNLFL
jgi:hypothetical protein